MRQFIQEIEDLPGYVLWQIAKIIQRIKLGEDKYTVHQDFIGSCEVEWFEESDLEISYDGDMGEYTIRWD